MSWPELHGTLTRRAMPETVAKILLDDAEIAAGFRPVERHLLARAARSRSGWYVSSMPDDFETVPDAAHQIGAVLGVFGQGPPVPPAAPRPDDPAGIAAWIDQLGAPFGWVHGMDWKKDRLPAGRRGVGTVPLHLIGRRAYNRHVRVLRNLHDKTTRMAGRLAFRRLVLVGRSGFACDIPAERFCADPAAAGFIAYYTARKNRRRQFTLAAKENPFDDIAGMLLERCERALTCDWEMIAGVCPRPQVLAHLSGEQAGMLLGRWWGVMRDCSVQLAAAWPGDRDGAGRRRPDRVR